ALEAAEQIPFKHLIVHLGERTDGWSQRTIEYALTALEHLGAFARPLGVKLLVETLTNDATTPEHLMAILDLGHLDNVGVCLDLGHANMTVGIPEAISILGQRIVSLHVHDNKGTRDEHLWPGDGTIDWKSTAKLLNGTGTPPAAVLEIHYTHNDAPADIPGKIQSAWEKLGA
ncbi:MAG: sugar phosphate isomerase/epimerase, partial [Planctomycetaceae bacterium]|nr:sugar phosphate isomerase/epimerase [Planctomycetaceae bacterium]